MQETWLKELGDQIKAARKKKGWSQEVLAEKIGVTTPTVSNCETGKHPPGFQVVADIAAALMTDFVVRGCRISPNERENRQEETPVQLCLDLDQDYTLTATFIVRPVQGAIHLTGLAKPPKRA